MSVRSESQAARIIRLEAELAVSRAERVKLETERDILRQAWIVSPSGDFAG